MQLWLTGRSLSLVTMSRPSHALVCFLFQWAAVSNCIEICVLSRWLTLNTQSPSLYTVFTPFTVPNFAVVQPLWTLIDLCSTLTLLLRRLTSNLGFYSLLTTFAGSRSTAKRVCSAFISQPRLRSMLSRSIDLRLIDATNPTTAIICRPISIITRRL